MSNTISAAFLPEFDREMSSTRKILERVPMDKFSWVPHEKSMPLGNLAIHVATLPSLGVSAITKDSMTMSGEYKTPPIKTEEELLAAFDKNVKEAREAIASASDEHLAQLWSLIVGEKTVSTTPRSTVLRVFMMNYLIHHRAQLGVYLRMNDIPIPGIYGPSADEKM